MHTTTSASALLGPEAVGTLLIQPTTDMSVAAQVATIVTTTSHEFRVPIVTADPTAAWVNEGAEIPISDASLDEAVATMRKLAGLSVVTNELIADSTPEASQQIGLGLARDLSRKLDAAWFGTVAAPAPGGLESLTGTTAVDAGTSITNVDPFIEAIASAEGVSANLTAFVANPADALALAKLKRGTGSNEPLIGAADTGAPTRRVVAGVPLFTSVAVTAGTIWGLDTSRTYLVIREDAEVELDDSVFFTSDRTAIRAKMRVGFAFPHPASIIKITIGS